MSRIREIITGRWLQRIREAAPELVSQFEALGVERYHELSDKLDHAGLWGKEARLFSPEEVRELQEMSLIKDLSRAFGAVEIVEFEERGYPEMFWRLVRPGHPEDVAGVHADSWFYTYTSAIPDEVQTQLWKVWAAVFAQPGASGLQVVPDSHKREWPHHSETRHGRAKPKLDVDESALDLKAVQLQPSEAIVFNRQLLHGGIRHRVNQTRVNVEFAIRRK